MLDNHRIDIPERFGLAEGAHVLIRERLSWSRKNRIDSTGVKITGAAEAYVDTLAKGLAVLEECVVSWDGVLDIETGRALPATHKGYTSDGFDPRFGDWLVDAIQAHYAEDDEGKPEGSTPSSEQ